MDLSTLCTQYHFTLKQVRPIPGSEAETSYAAMFL